VMDNNQRKAHILATLRRSSPQSPKDLRKGTGLSAASMQRSLSELIDAGQIIRTGSFRGSMYSIAVQSSDVKKMSVEDAEREYSIASKAMKTASDRYNKASIALEMAYAARRARLET
jgi:DeoR/GlpR family transcriptional regulator of sugar metabolism